MGLQFDIYPNPLVVAEALGHAADEIEHDISPIERSLAPVMESCYRTFELQGPGWKPWSTDYLFSQGSHHGPLPGQTGILVRTGETQASTEDAANYSVELNSIEWTGDATTGYAHYHLTGTSKMPQRSFTAVDGAARNEIESIWHGWLSAKVEIIQYASGPRSVLRGAGGRFVSG